MGLFDKAKAAVEPAIDHQLPTPPKPLGVFPQYTAATSEVIFKMTEARYSFSDSYTVRDATNAVVFHVDGKKMSMHDRKVISDAHKTPIYHLTKRIVSLHTTYDGVEPFENKIKYFSITKKISMGRPKLEADFVNKAGAGEKLEFNLTGSWLDRKAEIQCNGVPVARIARQFLNARQAVFDKDTYYISVAAHVDAALIVAIAVVLDELETNN